MISVTRRNRLVLGILVIFALAFAVYRPILPGDFLMDDRRLLATDNPLINGQLSPVSIWFQTDFALSTYVQSLEWVAWGSHPGWDHVVNILLHAVSAVLLWQVLWGLGIRGCWLAGAVFAVHPVCVNSVARIAEIKNTLSLPFFLLVLWFYLPYFDGESRGVSPWRYGLALVAYVLALMSKTSTVMLPFVLLACATWKNGRITREDWARTGPFFLLSVFFGLMSSWFQKHQAMVGSTLAPETMSERLAMAGQIFWFYLGKALLPVKLNLVYPEWKVSWIPDVLFVLVLVVCWRFRRGWGRHLMFGLGVFAITLAPVLGFFNSQFLTHWRVSDHLQYLPIIAPIALVSAIIVRLKPLSAVLIVLLSVLTFARATVFQSEESLYRDTLAKNPAAWGTESDLGVILASKQNYPEAMQHFKASVQTHPDNPDAESNIGELLVVEGKPEEAEPYFVAALKSRPNDPETQTRYATALMHQGRVADAMDHFRIALASSSKPEIQARLDYAMLLHSTGDLHQAVAILKQAVSLKPDSVEALNALAWLLATGWDDSARDGAAAVRYAEAASRLPSISGLCVPGTLAAAYAEAGRFKEAIATAQNAVQIEMQAGQTRFANMNRQLLQFYQSGRPYHERVPGQGN